MSTRVLAAALGIGLLAASCRGGEERRADASPPRSIKLATTTSTDNSGLLSELLPAFTAQHGIEVKVIAVGTGTALKHGEAGDVDVILVHARAAEDRFMAAGNGVDRREVMHNDFVILGPQADPAGIRGLEDAADALRRIGEQEVAFLSRGDKSGTHMKEIELWEAAGRIPGGAWYLATGQGMGAVLTLADEKMGYTLSDRGTYIAYREKLDLVVMVEGDPRLFNPYSVIAVNPERHPHVRYNEAMTFIDWLTSSDAQRIIGNFRRDGERLFHPDAVHPTED
ncbi:MAG: substrate-binding domain-containing protein [Pseudomonadota bacterium]